VGELRAFTNDSLSARLCMVPGRLDMTDTAQSRQLSHDSSTVEEEGATPRRTTTAAQRFVHPNKHRQRSNEVTAHYCATLLCTYFSRRYRSKTALSFSDADWLVCCCCCCIVVVVVVGVVADDENDADAAAGAATDAPRATTAVRAAADKLNNRDEGIIKGLLLL